MNTTVESVTSADGTRIALERTGSGPSALASAPASAPAPVILIGGDYEPPAERLAALRIPVLAVDGSNSEEWVHAGTRAVADAAPGGRYVTLDGQDHGVLHHPEALRPVLSNFLAGR